MERAIEIFAALSLTVIALSHMVQPQTWVEFFAWLREKGHAGVFALGLLYLNFGALVVSFHNIWHGWPLIFTILGWGQVLKGTLYLLAPEIGMKGLNRVSPEQGSVFIVGGAIILPVCAIMWWVVLSA